MSHSKLCFPAVCLIASALVVAGCSKKDAPANATGDPNAPAAASQTEKQGHPHMNFDELDKNKDGKITADEAGDAWKFLSKADTNGDGAVTKDEFETMHQHRRKD